MADFDPDAYLKTKPAETGTSSFDPDAYLSGGAEPADHGLSERQKLSPVQKALSPITEYPKHLTNMAKEAQGQIAEGWDQMTHPGQTAEKENAKAGKPAPSLAEGSHLSDVAMGAGKVALGNVANTIAPAMAGVRSIFSQPVEDTTGMPREYTEFASQLAIPGIGLRGLKSPGGPPSTPPPAPQFGRVLRSEGQTTGDLAAIQKEQQALRGESLGSEAHRDATAFREQQAAQLAEEQQRVTRELDPNGGQILSDSPNQGAGRVQDVVQSENARSKAGVTQAYDRAKAMPGEIHADVFRDMGQSIRNELNAGADPVVIDDKLTPMASHMIRDVDDRIAQLQIQNRAQPQSHALAGANDDSQIVGINLQGVEQVRKRLSAFRGDALRSGNATDARAAQAIMDAFDTRIDHAVNNGMFVGDQAAVDAYKAARAAHTERLRTFGNDAVGKRLQTIMGDAKLDKDPASLQEVGRQIWGESGVSPSELNMNVAKRLKKIVGEDSPEWAALRQNYFKKLVSTAEGVPEKGSGTIATNIGKALDGRLANIMFTPAQRDMLREFAELHRSLEVPQAGANWSNTATFSAKALDSIKARLGAVIGAVVGHALLHIPLIGESTGAFLGSKIASTLENAKNARQIQRQMPLISREVAKWQQAVRVQQRNNSIATRSRTSLAATNVASALSKLGIDNASTMRLLQAGPSGPGTSNADERAEGGRVNDDYNTSLGPADEQAYTAWKMIHAPNDSGADYDLRGAYKAGMVQDPDTAHFGDQLKKPNHPTFSDQSQYAVGDQLQRAGHWIGPEGPDQTFVPPVATRAEGGSTFDQRFTGTSQDDPSSDDMVDSVAARHPVDDSWKDREAKEGLAFRDVRPNESMLKRGADYLGGMASDIASIPKNIIQHPKEVAKGLSTFLPEAPAFDEHGNPTPESSEQLRNSTRERTQLWPERMIRSGATLAHDTMSGEVPQWQEDPGTGEVHTSKSMIERSQDLSGMAGSGGLGAGAADATLGSAPFLRPALKYNEKIYKAPANGTHLDAIPPEVYPEFERQAMSGEDISNFNFGFMNHKGQFLDRQKALEYAVDQGLIDPHDANQGALTSTLLSDSQKPGAALSALEHQGVELRPALKYEGKIYKGQKGDTHESMLEDLPQSFTKKVDETGHDNPLDVFNDNEIGFVNNKGQFLTREKAMDYAKKEGLIDENLQGKYFHSDLLSDSSQAGAPLAALEHAPSFYSTVEQTIQSAKQSKMHGEQWANWLKNQPGVKPDELQYTGIDKWLREQKGVVSKEQVADFIDKNKVQVDHVSKSGGKAFDEDTARDQAMEQAHDEAMDHFGPQGADRDPDRFHDAVQDRASELFAQAEREANQGGGNTKYSDRVLPGGSNYQEHLLTLPNKGGAYYKENAQTGKWDVYFGNDKKYNDYDILGDAENVVNQINKNNKSTGEFKSSHWDEPNVLVHTRTNEREFPPDRAEMGPFEQSVKKHKDTGTSPEMAERFAREEGLSPTGTKKSLHLDELQSDWGQQGRKKGFNLHPDESAEYQKLGKAKLAGADLTPQEQARLNELNNKIPIESGVPDMPFKQTEQWAGLAMKKMIHKAIVDGQERVSWTPGEAQIHRYWGDRAISAAVNRFNEVTKPESIRELSNDVLGTKMASLMPLNIVDGGVLAASKHNQIREAVISNLPVDVMDIFTSHHLSPEKLFSKDDVIGKTLSVDSSRRVAEAFAKATALTGAAIRAKLSRLESGGANSEILPTMRTNDLSSREVAGLLDPQRIFHSGSGSLPEAAASTRPIAKSLDAGRVANEKLPTTEFARLLNAHVASKYGHNELLSQGFEIPPGSGMIGFYNKMLPKIVEKLGKEWGVKVKQGQVGDQRARIVNDAGQVVNSFDNKTQAESWLNRTFTPETAAKYKIEEKPQPVFYFDIPKKMREDVSKKGFPLFSDTSTSGSLNQQNDKKKQIERPIQEGKTEPEINYPERASGGRVLASNIATPTPAQAKAGNYSKEHIHIHGLPITLENAKGSMRHGVGPDGKKWSAKLHAHYGYFKNSVGADLDHVDVYVGPHIKSDKVFIVNQINLATKQFDEHKVLIGFGSLKQALTTYDKGFSDGKGMQRVGSIIATTMPDFKRWLHNENTKKPFKSMA